MLKYDFILRCYFKMMYWHFNADAEGAGRGVWGICSMKLKEKKRGKGKEQREEEGEVEGGYKCSGEIWETVQDFHYL